MPAYPPREIPAAFSDSLALFSALVSRLCSEEMTGAPHDRLERTIFGDGTELQRQLLQDFLLRAASRERPEPVVGADGVVRRHKRETTRSMESIFGRVEVPRLALSMPGVPALMPMDARLNLPASLYSLETTRRLVGEVARSSFEVATVALGENTGAHVPKRQAEHLITHTMQDYDAFYANRPVPLADDGEFVVLTFDGKGIAMRPEALRPVTRKAAEKSKHKLGSRLSAGEKSNRKRMAEVAAVYTVPAWNRTPAQLLRLPDCGPFKPRPKPKGKRVWASVKTSARTVISDAFDEAEARDPLDSHDWVVLVDGTKIRSGTRAMRRSLEVAR